MSLDALLSLNASGMVGQAAFRKLLDRFGTAEEILRAPERALREVPGIGPVTAQAIRKARDLGPREREAAERAGIRILPFEDPAYPPSLQALYDRPLVLYVRGSFEAGDALAVAVVGSRQCTPYGERQAMRFGEELARLHVTVVSGLARGIDTHAHRGALAAAGGRTIAVLGSGLGRIYPSENERLSSIIAERGAVVSEFSLNAGPEPENFPRRNRIVAGLSLGVLVVEAGERSGALLTADWAAEAGRDVFGLPGSVESPMSRGCHLLLKQGAKLVENPSDLLEEIPALVPLLGERPASISPVERTLLGHLDRLPATAEQLAARSRLPEGAVVRGLASLVEKGMAVEDGSGCVTRAPVAR